MKFEKSMLNQIEHVSIALENCEEFEIAADDILDFWTSEVRMGVGYNGENEIDDGCLVISKRAFKNLSSAASDEYADGTTALNYDPEEVFYLCNRLLNSCDICQIYVKFKDGKDILFFVPYDPLESDLCQGEIDLSNCPSAELDANGDLLILFGASSHAYRRTDNNYLDLAIGLREEIKQLPKEPWKIRLTTFSNKENDFRCPRLFIDLCLTDNEYSDKKLSLVFEDVSGLYFDISLGEDEERRLWMSRISTGEIFVEIENFCVFRCHGVKTYANFSGESDDSKNYENDEIYRKAIQCELNEREMKLFADNCYAHTEKEFDAAAFSSAVQKVLRETISVQYFANWLKAYSHMLQFYRGIGVQNNKFYCTLATMMDRMQIRLSYYEKLSDCRALIEKSTKEMEEFYRNSRIK